VDDGRVARAQGDPRLQPARLRLAAPSCFEAGGPRRISTDDEQRIVAIAGARSHPRSKRIHWIQENLSCHWTPAIRQWAEQSNVELVPTPTYASYLNRIERHFGAIGEFVVKNADYLDWDRFSLAIANHLSYRNNPDRRRHRLEQTAKRLRLAA
jgi:hypothetical protein